MATILDKDLIRESKVKYDKREIIVTLTEKQKISFKLKGMKSGEVSIGIEQLYKQLIGEEDAGLPSVKVKTTEKKLIKSGDAPMINLNELKTHSLVTKMDYVVKVELDKIIDELINENTKMIEI
jgi:hypothetical protein